MIYHIKNTIWSKIGADIVRLLEFSMNNTIVLPPFEFQTQKILQYPKFLSYFTALQNGNLQFNTQQYESIKNHIVGAKTKAKFCIDNTKTMLQSNPENQKKYCLQNSIRDSEMIIELYDLLLQMLTEPYD